MATLIIPEPSILSPLTRTDAVNEIGGNRLNGGVGPGISFGRDSLIPADCAEHYSHAGMWHATPVT
jgi:hypothetical protein